MFFILSQEVILLTMETVDMKTAILCIAAEFERPYLEEWWAWHHNIGFDDIWVLTNNWTLDIPAPSYV